MFKRSLTPRVFGLPPGVDFPQALVDGLRQRLKGQPPHAMARVQLVVNTRRMARRIRQIFDQGPPSLLPAIHLITDLEKLSPNLSVPPALSPIRRRLELTRLIAKLIDADPTVAPRASLYALADSLAALIDEMQSEGVTAQTVADLDVSDQSGHWERAKQFLQIAQVYLAQTQEAPDAETRQRLIVEGLITQWADEPPTYPVIIAGSTGSRETTALLMDAVSKLPQGALILPGFDTLMPSAVWKELDDAMVSEDHPQYRFQDIMRRLSITPSDIALWADVPAPSAARNALVSLSLRPAPVTHAWLTEGPNLRDLGRATRKVTLLEAPSPRIEALAIAMRLRKAADEGKKAALITPDRMLTRQVTAALDRWGILPDDSAGTPLHLSPPGRFLRHVAQLFTGKLTAALLLTLLKHPLTHSAANRNEHQLWTQLLELEIRRIGLPYPDSEGLQNLGRKAADRIQSNDQFLAWVNWVAEVFASHEITSELPLLTWVENHLSLANQIAAGTDHDQPSELWRQKAGQKAQEVMDGLRQQAVHGDTMSAADYRDLLATLLSGSEVRDRDAPHPNIMIWGTLEARVQGADLVILGGLNDGTWPQAPGPDPWLNRQMRKKAGLLLPERRIGLSAHDYQQAIAAPEVWLTRAIRSDEAETIPSRWLNRLGNLMQGLTQPEAQTAWSDMKARGAYWIAQTTTLERADPCDPAPRPSPKPPVSARLKALSVTEIKHLIRDPYAIYAKHVLRLRPLNPLTQSPDAPLRGTILHSVLERFIRSTRQATQLLSTDHLLRIANDTFEAQVPWPTARLIWRARLQRVSDWFIAQEHKRRDTAHPVAFEKSAKGVLHFADLSFNLTGYADRIDMTAAGDAILYDYKTGVPPSKKEQHVFDKQLLIEAAMIEEGAFKEIGKAQVNQAVFIGLGPKPVEIAAPLDEEPPSAILAGLRALLARYGDQAQGFTARRMVKTENAPGDYDQLARFGEWDGTTAPAAQVLK
ncbi:MAG: double-strand break repair protein AddB [Pseudomonadota bacterium]